MLYTFIRKKGGFVLKDRPFLTPHGSDSQLIPHDILEHPTQIPTNFHQEEIMSFGGMHRVRQNKNQPFGWWIHQGLLNTFYASYYQMGKGNIPEGIKISKEAKDLTQKIDQSLVLKISEFKTFKDISAGQKEAVFRLKNHNYKTLFTKCQKEFIEYLINLGIKDFDSRFKEITQRQAWWLYWSINRKVKALSEYDSSEAQFARFVNCQSNKLYDPRTSEFQFELDPLVPVKDDRVQEFTFELDPLTPSCLIYNIKKPTKKKLNIPSKGYSSNSSELYSYV